MTRMIILLCGLLFFQIAYAGNGEQKNHEYYGLMAFAQLPQLEQELQISDKNCPRNMTILKRKNGPDLYNYLSFGNFSGICEGMTKLNHRFGHLAIWNTPPAKGDPQCDLKEKYLNDECYDFYRNKIKQLITQGKVTEFPDFNNLAEFSAHRSITPILLGYASGIPFNDQVAKDAIPNRDPQFLEKLIARVKNNHMAQVNIARPQSLLKFKFSRTVGHAILAYDTMYMEDYEQEVVCVNDPNYSPMGGRLDCNNFLFMEDDVCHYHTKDGG
ncbi:MAG: hypothetical protein WCG27_13025, partial [Pseudomonadota bacterium]